MRKLINIAAGGLLLASLPFAATIAQSTSGNIAGEAKAGDTVVVTNSDTGFKRELKIEKDGKYQIRRVPTGDYQVVRVRKDGSIDPAQSVTVRPDGTGRVMSTDADPGAAAASGS